MESLYEKMKRLITKDNIKRVYDIIHNEEQLTSDDREVILTALSVVSNDTSPISKEEFVRRQVEEYSSEWRIDTNVLQFIADILFHQSYGIDTRRLLFRSGYCLYFARMLKDAFNRGSICITYPLGHCVWQDINGVCYDIEGVYTPREHECECIIPFIYFPEEVTDDFWHVATRNAHKDYSQEELNGLIREYGEKFMDTYKLH